MSNEQELEGKSTVELFSDLDKTALKSEKFIEKYAKQISYAFGAVVLGVVGYYAYQQFVVAPQNQEATLSLVTAQSKVQKAQEEGMASGKTTTTSAPYQKVYDEFSGTNAGKLASYQAAITEFNNGSFQKAHDLMAEFSSDNDILMAMKFGLMADALANLKQNDQAAQLLDKAISASSDLYTSYLFTRKAGIFALANNKKEEAKKYFGNIEQKFVDIDGGMSDAYIEMVKYY
jgi:Tetratricopeptide repeat-like domain